MPKLPEPITESISTHLILTVLIQEHRERVKTMLALEFKAYGKSKQFSAIDEALRTVQFIRSVQPQSCKTQQTHLY